jgi:hypothetical protein
MARDPEASKFRIEWLDGSLICGEYPKMSETQIEKRLAALEMEVANLRKKIAPVKEATKPWWEINAGEFANDPMFEEAMELGRQYRKSS